MTSSFRPLHSPPPIRPSHPATAAQQALPTKVRRYPGRLFSTIKLDLLSFHSKCSKVTDRIRFRYLTGALYEKGTPPCRGSNQEMSFVLLLSFTSFSRVYSFFRKSSSLKKNGCLNQGRHKRVTRFRNLKVFFSTFSSLFAMDKHLQCLYLSTH